MGLQLLILGVVNCIFRQFVAFLVEVLFSADRARTENSQLMTQGVVTRLYFPVAEITPFFESN